ncbi:MAG: DNA-3-methyladenine glycosylase 2 family protein [Rhodothermaceae bacterium]
MNELYSKARINKDKSFDGKFYFGVKTTGIFCRPSCPSPIAREKNVLYFNTVFEALEKEFTPCYRYRPDIETEYYNGNAEGSLLVSSALEMICNGYLNDHSVDDLARANNISERHLRKLFTDNIGISPNKIAIYHRAIFAKRLILHSDKSFTDVAFAASFNSLRQFNDVIKKLFGKTPTEIRKISANRKNNATLLVKYKQPFNFSEMLSFMRPRTIKGVEVVTESGYTRTFRIKDFSGSFTVTDNPKESALNLSIDTNDVRCYMEIYNRVRKMFDLDTDMNLVKRKLKKHKILFGDKKTDNIPRIPVAFDPFEFVIRAILGQQISVKAATTLAGRIAEAAGMQYENDINSELKFFFPTPEEFAKLNLDNIGLTRTRKQTLKLVANAILDGNLNLKSPGSFEDFHKAFSAIKGIGDWTVNYVAMRALGMNDCFPATDLGIIKALSKTGTEKPKEIIQMAEQWRPYRSYATLCLWKHYS